MSEQRCSVGSYGGCLTHGKPNFAYCLDAIYARCDAAESALKELVALKDLKDAQGKTADYEERQPKAWAAARAVLDAAEVAP